MKFLKITIVIFSIMFSIYLLAKFKYSTEYQNLKFLKNQVVSQKVQGQIIMPTTFTSVRDSYSDSTRGMYHVPSMIWNYDLPPYYAEPIGKLYLDKDSIVTKIIISERTIEQY